MTVEGDFIPFDFDNEKLFIKSWEKIKENWGKFIQSWKKMREKGREARQQKGNWLGRSRPNKRR